MDIKLSKIFGTIWCVLVFSTSSCENIFSLSNLNILQLQGPQSKKMP